ncbi:MAG: hypothetical protein ACI9QQ_002486, partial [Myxococcota bacterium]
MQFNVLVLAGRRGPIDDLAKAANATHRALLDIAGEPMAARVLKTLVDHPDTGSIMLCSDA